MALGCDKQQPAPQPPPVAAQPAPAPAEQPKPVQKAPDRYEGTIAIATFNAQWAHDHEGPSTPTGKKARAKDDKAWAWKADAIGKLLAKQAPEIVALQEVGGEKEVADIVAAIAKHGGPTYGQGFVKSSDPVYGHQLAILSTLPISNERRLEVHNN